MTDPFDVIRAFDPEKVEEYLKIEADLFQDGALPKKFKILIALALDAIQSASSGVRAYADRALKAGATWDEIKEALRVSYYIGFAGPLWTSIRGLEDVVPKK